MQSALVHARTCWEPGIAKKSAEQGCDIQIEGGHCAPPEGPAHCYVPCTSRCQRVPVGVQGLGDTQQDKVELPRECGIEDIHLREYPTGSNDKKGAACRESAQKTIVSFLATKGLEAFLGDHVLWRHNRTVMSH